MNGLFLLFMNNFLAFFSPTIVAIICNALVLFLTILCTIIVLKKEQYSFSKRLWVVFDFVGICLIEFWLEMHLINQISYLILTIGSCFLGLSICLFLPAKKREINQDGRMLARFLDRCVSGQKEKDNVYMQRLSSIENEKQIKPSNILSSPIFINNKSDDINGDKEKQEIDFSHIKDILGRLDYYPLKEQDKKSANELKKAILEAEENGLDISLKQTINDGLGALLKIMAKYAV